MKHLFDQKYSKNRFADQETITIYQLKTVVLLNIFVETMINFSGLFDEWKVQKNCFYFKKNSFVTLEMSFL